jgi:hypothetical protein
MSESLWRGISNGTWRLSFYIRAFNLFLGELGKPGLRLLYIS